MALFAVSAVRAVALVPGKFFCIPRLIRLESNVTCITKNINKNEMKFHFINPSEFIAGGSKKAKKPPLPQYLFSAVVEGPYREVCSPLWISLQKSASFSGFCRKMV